MPGKFIIVEGLDCSGKTTLIKEILREIPNSIYCKGIGNPDLIGRFAKLFHSTLSFSIELIFRTYANIIPNLNKGKIILQDRYYTSVASYLPKSGRFYNKIISKILRFFLIKPDAVIYLTLPKDERRRRLIEKGNFYELFLAKNPNILNIREQFYENQFKFMYCPKIKINTKNNNVFACTRLAKALIKKDLNFITLL